MEKNIPTVSLWKFLGHSIDILKNPLPFHRKNFEKHGDTFRLQIGFGKSVVFSRDADFARYTLQKNHKNYTKSTIQTVDLAKYVGKGLLTSEGNYWKKQRKLIQPAFHKKQLTSLLEKVLGAIQTELLEIKTGVPQDVFPVFNDLAFQTVVKALFSSAVEPSDIKRLQQITEQTQQMLVKELRQPYLKWWFHASGKLKSVLQLTAEARGVLRKLIHDRKASNKKEGDLLDMLLDARYEDGSAMEEDQLIDEILILFSAGHETTSNALTFTCELLARHPKVQENIFLELKREASKKEDLMEYMKACSYTKQVVEESMRLYPPAYFIDRVNIEQDAFNGMKIPKGTNLLFSLHEIHIHSNFWDDPEAFKPERFSEGSQKFSSHYYPFGAGPRMCIGNNFAMYEMILAVSEVVSTYKISEKQTPIEILPLITLKPKDAILEFNLRC